MAFVSFAKAAAAAAVLALLPLQAFACFTVYNHANQQVYSGLNAPIDMSFQIHEKLPASFPGGHLVFGSSSTDCPEFDQRKVSPLLTNVPAGAARQDPAKPAALRRRA
jgi:hypothetical protein